MVGHLVSKNVMSSENVTESAAHHKLRWLKASVPILKMNGTRKMLTVKFNFIVILSWML